MDLLFILGCFQLQQKIQIVLHLRKYIGNQFQNALLSDQLHPRNEKEIPGLALCIRPQQENVHRGLECVSFLGVGDCSQELSAAMFLCLSDRLQLSSWPWQAKLGWPQYWDLPLELKMRSPDPDSSGEGVAV